VPETWTTDRLVAWWSRPNVGGWFVEVERQRRRDIGDVALRTSAYRRAGDWTFAGDVAIAPDAHFLSGAGGGGEVSYRAVGTIVASGAYHIRQYPAVTIHQFTPGVTWYRARGELQARLFVTRDTSIPRTSTAGVFRATYDAAARLRLGAGVSIGERIFDIEPLALDAGNSRLAYAEARLRLTTRNFVLASVTVAHEEPDFRYVAATLGYRRTF
jgi:YaiO family outer membrane protein